MAAGQRGMNRSSPNLFPTTKLHYYTPSPTSPNSITLIKVKNTYSRRSPQGDLPKPLRTLHVTSAANFPRILHPQPKNTTFADGAAAVFHARPRTNDRLTPRTGSLSHPLPMAGHLHTDTVQLTTKHDYEHLLDYFHRHSPRKLARTAFITEQVQTLLPNTTRHERRGSGKENA